MGEIDIGTPNAKQILFFESDTRYIAYGGSRGGGKSWAVRVKATLLALHYPGIVMLLLRKTLPELRENHIRPLQKLLNGVAIYRESEKSFIFQNGSRLRLGYLDSENDVNQYQGQQFDIIFLDEATHFTKFQFDTLTACLRGVNEFPKRFYLTCNPGGVGHEWVKRLFIDKIYINGEVAEEYTFIAAKVYDNTALMATDLGYVKMLENLPKSLRRAWLDGDWNIFDGQYFSEFRTDAHVIDPIAIPEHWKRYITIDYGMDMLAALWVAVDEQGRAYAYNELYEGKDNAQGNNASGHIVSDAAKRILEINGDNHIDLTLAPPDLWNRRQETGRSAADIFLENGVSLTKTNNERVNGWRSIREYLKIEKGEQGEDTSKLKIFSNCTNLIRTLPAVQYDSKNPEDVANSPHELTHMPDALRGFCIYWTTNADTPKGEKVKWQDDMYVDYYRANAEGQEYLLKKWGSPF